VATGGSPQFQLVRFVDAPPELVWRSLVALLDRSGGDAPLPSEVGGEVRFRLDDWELLERTETSEAPHRRVYRVVEGAPVTSYVGTSEITAVDGGSRITWTVDATAAPARAGEFAAFVARAEVAVTRGLDAVVAGVPPLDEAAHRFTFERRLAVPASRVWDAIAAMYADADYSYTVAGDPPIGEGAVIRYRYGDWLQHALVVTWEPPVRRVYEMLDGAPVRRYRGTTTVVDDADGALLTWECEFALDPEQDADEYLRLAHATVGRAVERVVSLIAA
jgi:uncharacterized protein YndB with AHSA1/START domain